MTIDNEGSVSTEDSDIDEAEETQDGTENESSKGGEETQVDSQTEDQTSDSSLKSQEKDGLTDKGTKIDPNPMSALNQQLANERAKIRQYEEVLNNPTLLKGYVAQFENKGEVKTEDKSQEMRIEDIQTTEDLQKYQRQEKAKVDAKLKELDSAIAGVKNSQKDTVVATNIQSDIATVRETYPELNPKDSSYSKELDQAVGKLYEKMDLDPKTNSFKGSVSIKEIADIVMAAAGSSRKAGSTQAMTEVRDKRTGRVTSGASTTAPDETNMTVGQTIASRIRAARGNRR